MVIELWFGKVSDRSLPESAKQRVPTDHEVFQFRVKADSDSIRQLTQRASDITDQYTQINNDLYDPNICPTDTAKVIHALEHLVVLALVDQQYFDLDQALSGGEIALTLPGNSGDGSEIACFWIRKGLVSLDQIETVLREVVASNKPV